MNRVEDINLFLNEMLNISKTEDLNELHVYNCLIKYKINNQTTNKINFSDWIEYFNNNKLELQEQNGREDRNWQVLE